MQFDLKVVKELAKKGLDKARQYAEGLNELEVKVEEATNSDKWGPHGSLMQEITKRSFILEDYKQILAILARRLHSEPNQWRHVYKALLLLEYMAKNGPERMVSELKSNGRVFAKLQSFQYIDSQNKDQGINVRNRAKELWALVNDPDAVAAEREKAAKNRSKFGGMDSFSVASSNSPRASTSTFDRGTNYGTPGVSVTTPVATSPRETRAEEDPIEATERRLQQLNVSSSDANTPKQGMSPVVHQVKSKPKLSDIPVDSSIEATFQNFPIRDPTAEVLSVKPPQVTSAPQATGEYVGQNLLDFFDDPPPERPAATDASRAADDDWTDFSGANSPGDAMAAPSKAAAAPPTAASVLNNPPPSAAAALQPPSDPFGDIPSLPPVASTLSSAKAGPVAIAGASPVPSLAQTPSRPPLPADDFAAPLPAASRIEVPQMPVPPSMPSALPAQAMNEARKGAESVAFDPFQSAPSVGVPAANGHAFGQGQGGPALKGGDLKDMRDPFADLL